MVSFTRRWNNVRGKRKASRRKVCWGGEPWFWEILQRNSSEKDLVVEMMKEKLLGWLGNERKKTRKALLRR